jgi:fructosamine-3-kinase
LTEGEYHSASAIDAVVPGLVPNAVGWGEYQNGEFKVFFYLGDYHLKAAPDPASFAAQIAELHSKAKSPTRMFGFPVSTVCGMFERTVKWEEKWAHCFANQLTDVIKFDNETNGP